MHFALHAVVSWMKMAPGCLDALCPSFEGSLCMQSMQNSPKGIIGSSHVSRSGSLPVSQARSLGYKKKTMGSTLDVGKGFAGCMPAISDRLAASRHGEGIRKHLN